MSGSDPSSASGFGHKVIGAIKETTGHLFGASGMENRGAAQRTQGEAEMAAAQRQGQVQGRQEQLQGTYHETKGAALGRTGEELSGKAERTKGNIREAAHNA